MEGLLQREATLVGRHDRWRMAAKRGFDIVVALVALTACLPALAVAAVAIVVDSGRPVLFWQQRLGREGRLFRLYKLRTMVPGAEAMLPAVRHRNELEDPLFKIRRDPRITRVGRHLRRWSLDEVPQLWNVLRGDMSVVGPRPALPEEALAWAPELRRRLEVRPGVTGPWQVSGRADSSFVDYVRLDLEYIDNLSLLTDATIVAKTVPTVLRRRGAY